MEYIVNSFFIGIYRRNILKCECINVDKSLYLKGIEGIVEGDFFVWMLGRCTRERVRVEGVGMLQLVFVFVLFYCMKIHFC